MKASMPCGHQGQKKEFCCGSERNLARCWWNLKVGGKGSDEKEATDSAKEVLYRRIKKGNQHLRQWYLDQIRQIKHEIRHSKRMRNYCRKRSEY